MGAKVVKIENKVRGGDVTRSWKLPSEDSDLNLSAYFCAVNWKKEHLFLDLNSDEDRDQCIQLIRDADILITNFKTGDAAKFGLTYEKVRELNTKIIYAALTGFGPDSDRIAYDLVLQAETGFMSINGTEDSGPIKMPVAFIDLFAAHQLKEGILIALLKQTDNSSALHVEVSLYESALASLANQATNWLMTNELPKRMGSTHPNIAPYGELFETEDKEVVTFGIGSDQQFVKLCDELGLSELSDDDRFGTNSKRVENRQALEELLKDAVANRLSEGLLNRLIQLRVPVAKVKNLQEVFEDETAKELVLEEEIEGVKTKRVKTTVFKIRS